MSNSFIKSGYLPCVTQSNRKSCIEYTVFISMKNNPIKFDSNYTSDESSSSGTSSDNDDEPEQKRQQPKSMKYSKVAARISAYVGSIKGL